MTHRLGKYELRRLRNDIRLRDVVFALKINWRFDDQKFKFICPLCNKEDTSIHPTTNLGRCFNCNRNFNTIDLVMLKKKCGFRTGVQWLLALESMLKEDDAKKLLFKLSKISEMN